METAILWQLGMEVAHCDLSSAGIGLPGREVGFSCLGLQAPKP